MREPGIFIFFYMRVMNAAMSPCLCAAYMLRNAKLSSHEMHGENKDK
ncbi:hypothetical protein SAMN04487926_13377 [Paraburkholderia steynii]|uniref:Uncharacterized protein n=1 Tax=Paraburkholderia steynii TaxID=1245441 RepID=A0A7Z7BFC7_9BURK|nr:hypothetical protein SAMN04487926_13377 [Paraburkholderia steynii]